MNDVEMKVSGCINPGMKLRKAMPVLIS